LTFVCCANKIIISYRCVVVSRNIHNLLRIARTCGLQMSGTQEEFLLEVTAYNIKARYPDYKKSFQRKANEEFTLDKIARIEEMQKWLRKIIAR